MLDAFLGAQPENPSAEGHVLVGNPYGRDHMYVRFRRWLKAVLTMDETTGTNPLNDSMLVERRTGEILCRLEQYAVKHFSRVAGNVTPAQSTGNVSPVKTETATDRSLKQQVPRWMM